MSYEVAIISLGSSNMQDALKRLGDAVASTPLLSNLLGCWYSEIGEFGRIVTIRRKQAGDDSTRAQDLARASSDFSSIADMIAGMRIDTFASFPFMPDMPTGKFGPLYEMRDYVLKAGSSVSSIIKNWEPIFAERMKYSPCLAAFYAVTGAMPRALYLWPYPSFEERQQTRAKVVAAGFWPPKGSEYVSSGEVTLLNPTGFSPLQ
jgi:NIPSNAP